MNLDNMWGQHLLINGKAGNLTTIQSEEAVYEYVQTLCDIIDMKAYGEPIIERFATHDPTKGGLSLLQLIETSCITGHFVDINGDHFIDIFSCKSFDVDEALKFTLDFFGSESVSAINILRGNEGSYVERQIFNKRNANDF